jgi:DNA-binding beta-propeller fold protein YncE
MPPLSQVTGSPFATGRVPESVAFSPDGKLLATANPLSVAFSPGGGLLAVANPDDGTLSVFSIDPTASTALTPISGSPFAVGKFPDSVAFSPSGGDDLVLLLRHPSDRVLR